MLRLLLLRGLSLQARIAAVAASAVLVVPAMLAAVVSAPQDMPAAAPQRTLLVTGAHRGLGLEFARQYQAAGWKVIGTAREPQTASELKALGVRVEALDVASAESVAALAQRLADVPIDLLINNAGVSGSGGKPLQEVDLAEYERVMAVNAIGPVRVTQALLPNLRAGRGRQIVSITSILGSITGNTGGGFWGYRESKAALDMFVRSLAAELKAEGFVCIAMHPGWVKTDMGGPDAELTPEQSIAGMRKVIDGLKAADTGSFFQHDGATVPW